MQREIVGADRIGEVDRGIQIELHAFAAAGVGCFAARDADEPGLDRAGATVSAGGAERRQERLSDQILRVHVVAATRQEIAIEVVHVEPVERGESGGIRRGLVDECGIAGHGQADRR